MSEQIPNEIPLEAIENEEGEKEKIQMQGRELYKRLIATMEDSMGIKLQPNHYSVSVFDWRRILKKEIDGQRIEINLRVGDQINTGLFVYISGIATQNRFQEWTIKDENNFFALESHKDLINDLELLMADRTGEKLYRTYVEHQMSAEVSIDRTVFDDIKETAEKLKSKLAQVGVSLNDFEDVLLPLNEKRAEEIEQRSQIVNQYMNSETSNEETQNQDFN